MDIPTFPTSAGIRTRTTSVPSAKPVVPTVSMKVPNAEGGFDHIRVTVSEFETTIMIDGGNIVLPNGEAKRLIRLMGAMFS